jgi:hypothetical protein
MLEEPVELTDEEVTLLVEWANALDLALGVTHAMAETRIGAFLQTPHLIYWKATLTEGSLRHRIESIEKILSQRTAPSVGSPLP